MKQQTLFNSIIVFALMLAGAGLGIFMARQDMQENQQPLPNMFWPNPKQIESFETVDSNGNIFGLDQLMGKWSFLFFGFTHCPDVCPVTLSVLNEVQKKLEQEAEEKNIQTIFISIDPERDTPGRMKDYVNYFNEKFIGLTGSQQQVQTLAGQIGIMYFKGEQSADGDYLMDHSASVFLTDPRGRLISIFSAPHAAATIYNDYLIIKEFVTERDNS